MLRVSGRTKLFFLISIVLFLIYATVLTTISDHEEIIFFNSKCVDNISTKSEKQINIENKTITLLLNRSNILPVAELTTLSNGPYTLSTTVHTVNTLMATKKPSIFECYKNKRNRQTLPNILQENIKKDRSIVFLETSCKFSEKGRIELNIRQACSIESASLANPEMDVHLLVTTPSNTVRNNGDIYDKIMEALTSYKNFKMNYIDIDEYFRGSPVEELYKSGKMEFSYVPMVHISDVLRFITMWRFGSIYLDLDVLVLKSLNDLGPNFTGLENQNDVAAGVMKFQTSGPGNEWINQILTDINNDFRPDLWKYNANDALKRFLDKLCNDTSAANMTPEKCQSFMLYPANKFYAVGWENWHNFFDKSKTSEVLEQIKDSIVTHMWNYLSSNEKVTVGNGTAYDELAKKYCPKVYSKLPIGSTF